MSGTTVVLGNEKHPVPKEFEDDEEDDGKAREQETGWRLTTIPIMLSLYEVNEEWLGKSAEPHDGNPVHGQFSYNPRINTDDGVIDDKWPSVSVWVGVGPETFRLVRDRLLRFQKYDFEIGVTVLFPEGSIEKGWMGATVRWEGTGLLPITEATFVWRREDWSVDYKKRERLVGPPRDYEPTREHADLLAKLNELHAGMQKITAPLWIAVAALVGLFVWHR